MAALVASAVAISESLTDGKQKPVELPPAPNFEVIIPQLKRTSSDEFQKFADEEPEASDDEEIEPAYYYENMGIPVFTPTMEQFKSFKKFVDKINHYGMQSGIIKVIPPKEWTDSLPALDDKVKDIKIKNPIEQHIAGTSGEYRQTNVQKQRTYNLPQWRHVCDGSDHQPPAKRGERRRGQTQPVVRRNTRSRKSIAKNTEVKMEEDVDDTSGKTNPPTPESPADKVDADSPEPEKKGFGRQPRQTEETPGPEVDSHGRQPRKKGRRTAKERAEDRELADEVAYEGFDYRAPDDNQYTPERCTELEKAYWRTLTYNSPLYGADMPGSLFDDSTTSWNVAKLENLLDCLGKKLPGVNTAYLYLGMWKSTFSWHLEDMDLYSINYIHFGAPKQWYSISRSDKVKFEQVMKDIWPNEARKCSQFLRHKTFLVSPTLLGQHGIKVNRLVHHQGEFVITFPFGYHSGYNMGYNCAESVNFATRSWLDFGRDAKKCECVGDSVFVDVDEIERKLRGDPTDDEEEEEEEEDYGYYEYEYEEGETSGRPGDFPTPPESVEGKSMPEKQRKRKSEAGAGAKMKRARIKLPKSPPREPCVLCPNDTPSEPLLHTEGGGKAHRLCAIYTPETYFKWDHQANREVVANIQEIPKARLELKCIFCRQKKGSCFQCSAKKCTRAYHATCAAAAGVLVNMVDVQVTGEGGETYAQTNIDYRCKVHRPKRPKDWDAEKLEEDPLTRKFSTALIKDDVIQMQYFGGDIFAGVVIENRKDEEMVLVRILPKGELVEVEWKWILAQDPSETNFPDAITTAPLYPDPHYPPARKAKVAYKDIPKPDQPFGDVNSNLTWGELVVGEPSNLQEQIPVHGWWYYLGELSTEYISKFSEDPARRVPNSTANFVPPKQSRQGTYRPQAIKQEPGTATVPHINYQNALRQPDYAMQNLPPGYRPQFYNGQFGYGFPPQQQYHPGTSSPPNAPMAKMSSAAMPHYNSRYVSPTTTITAPQDCRPSLSLPLQQLFGEHPTAPEPTRPAEAPPYIQVVLATAKPMEQQQPQQPHHHHIQQQSPQQQQSVRSTSPQYQPPYKTPSRPPKPPSQQLQNSPPNPPPPAQQPIPQPDSFTFMGETTATAATITTPSLTTPAPATLPPTATNTSSLWGSSAPLADITAAIAKLARERAKRGMAQPGDGSGEQQQPQQQVQA